MNHYFALDSLDGSTIILSVGDAGLALLATLIIGHMCGFVFGRRNA